MINYANRFAKVVLTPVTVLAILIAPLGILMAPESAHALAVAPGNTGCDLFTQDAEYVLGNPPPVSIWQPTFGTWIIADDSGEDVLHQTDVAAGAPNDPIILLEAIADIGDAVFSTDLQFVSGATNAGLAFRAQDHNNLYLFRISGSTAELFKRVNGTYTSLGSTPFAPSVGTWYSLNVLMIGDNIRAYIDDTLMLTATDSEFETGKLGLRTHATEAFFDNTCVGFGPFTWDVDDNSSECPLADFTSIQDAIDFASTGDTIHVCAGTYEEQVVITKQLKLSGDGDTSIIKLPGVRPSDGLKTITLAGFPKEADPLIWIEGVENATLEKFLIDGANINDISGWRATVGVVLKNGTAAIQNNTITNFNGPACWGCSTGYGIWSEGIASTATIKDNKLSNIQADFITIQSGKANVMNSTLVGLGLGSYDAQMGISYEQGTSGIILNNTLSEFSHPWGEISTAISVMNAATTMTLSGNKLMNNEQSIVIKGTNGGKLISSEITGSQALDILLQGTSGWTLAQNKLTGSIGRGLVLLNSSNTQTNMTTIIGTALEGIVLESTGGSATNANYFVQNTVDGAMGDGILFTMDGTAGNSMDANVFTSNTIKNGNGNGIMFEAVGANRITKTSLKANKILDNKFSGLNVRKSTNAVIEANTITGNKHHGILLANLVNGSTVSKNTIKSNKRHGIALQGNSDNNKFTFNTVKANGVPGFFDLYWDSDASATGNAPSMNFYTTKQPPLFWK